MPDSHSPSDPSGRAGWRSKAKPAATGPRAAKAGGWSKKTDDGVDRSVMRYRTKIFLWLTLFVALVVGFVVWLIWTPMLTPFLVVTAVNYEYPLPPNAFALEDAQRLADLHAKEVLKYAKIDFESKESGLNQLRQELEKAKPGGPGKNLIVLYLSMHGAVNAAGEPCLIPPGAAPLDDTKWLRVADLLDALFPADNPKWRSDKIKKLLILDSNRMDMNWSLGLLRNTFADRLPAVVEEKKIPGLAVLNSAAMGQIGWSAPELRSSVFGYFLSKGLNGAARTEKNGKIITLQDLLGYLTNNVSLWVSEKRANSQSPFLIPQDADFPIVYAQPLEKQTALKIDNTRDPRWDEVQKLWIRHAALKNNREKPYSRMYPLEWEKIQQGLLRLEQLLQAGSAYETQFTSQLTITKNDLTSIETNETGRNLNALSLPLMTAFGIGPSESEWKKLSPPWKEPVKVEAKEKEPEKQPLPKTEDKADDKNAKADTKEDQAKKPTPDSAPPPAPIRYTYLAASSAAWNWAANESLGRKDLQKVLQFVDGGINRTNGIEFDVVEVQFLRMLEKYLDPMVWSSSPQSVKNAILARKMAETAAAPKDDRAFYWIFPQADAGDQLRREAEDRLFVGSNSALREAEGKWNAANNIPSGNYQQAVQTAETIADAYRLRDQAYGEIPYLIRWIFSSTHRRPANDAKLFDTIQATKKLALQLDDWNAENAIQEIATATGVLKKNLDELETAYYRDCTNTQGDDKEKLARLLNVLVVPLVTGKDRNDYWDNCLKIITSSSEFKDAVSGDARLHDVAKIADPFLAQLEDDSRNGKTTQLHPLLLALESATSGDDTTAVTTSAAGGRKHAANEELATQGSSVRTLLSSGRQSAEEHLALTIHFAQIEKPSLAKLEDIRRPLSQTDRMVRAFAPLLGKDLSWDDPRHDPLRRLQDLDRHNLLLWQAWRMLQDFWGPMNPGDQPYFEIAARAYLKSASDLFKEDAALKEGAVCKRLESGRKAAQIGLLMEKPRSPSLDREDPSVKQSLFISAPVEFPPGEAAVYLQAGDDSLFPVASKSDLKKPDLRRMAYNLAKSEKPQSLAFWILNDEQLNESPQLHAVAYYRGFLCSREFYVNAAVGRDIVWAKKESPKPTITVRGNTLKKSNLLFIFDCSGSMSKKVVIRSKEGGPSQETTRIVAARKALETILDRLARPPYPYNVGLIIYGHRVGWIDDPRGSKNNFHIVVRDPANPLEFIPPPPDFNVHPSDDVEIIQPLGQFTEDESTEMKKRLDSLRPLGETPLYLSIIQALRVMESADPDSPRRIIVLTDGGNEQTGGDPSQIKKLNDVKDALEKPTLKNVKLDVLGFDLVDAAFASAEEKASAQELIKFAGQQGYHPVSDSSSLTSALEKTLGLVKFQVLRIGDGKIVTDPPLDLNSTCKTMDHPGEWPVGYRVRLENPEQTAQSEVAQADVAVEGGEALDLSVKEAPIRGRRQLVHHRYVERLRDSLPDIPIPGDPHKRKVFLGAHLPEATGGGAKFFVSVQNADPEQFSPRPAEVWAEIKPVMQEGSPDAPAYIFYDRLFEPKRPVPVLELDVPNWPPETKDAEIRLWCKFDKTPPNRQASVSELRGKTVQLDGLPDVAFSMETKRGAKSSDPYQVIITESHPQGGDLGLAKVEMDPLPKSIKRHYNDKTGIIEHTFFYDSSTASEADRYQVLFTTKEKLKEGAVATPPERPLKVKVPPSPITGE